MLLLVAPIFLAIGLAIAAKCGAGKRELIATFVGFVVAAAIPAGIVVSDPPGRYEDFSMGWFAVVYAFSFGFVAILGVPAFLLLRPFGPGHWWSVASAGTLLGLGVSSLFRLPSGPDWHDFVMTGPLSGLSALTFWLIWRYGGGAGRQRDPV
jgi:hypothetical protein